MKKSCTNINNVDNNTKIKLRLRLSEEQIKQKLQSALTIKRYKHSLGVAQEAVKLAVRYGADVDNANIAGLLHDCAKDYPDEMKFRMSKEYHVELDDCMRSQPELIHSFLGAEVAKREYQIDEIEIINAICYHTTGRVNMSILEKIIFMADWIEPNRKEAESVIVLRRLAYENLDTAIIKALEYSLLILKTKGKEVHTLSVDALNYLKTGGIYGEITGTFI